MGTYKADFQIAMTDKLHWALSGCGNKILDKRHNVQSESITHTDSLYFYFLEDLMENTALPVLCFLMFKSGGHMNKPPVYLTG